MKRIALLLLVGIIFLTATAQVTNYMARRFGPTTFAALGSPSSNNVRWCSDCTAGAPCTGSGSGAYAYRVGTAWNCGTGASGTGTIGGTLGSVDNAITRANGTGGLTAQGSAALIDDSGRFIAGSDGEVSAFTNAAYGGTSPSHVNSGMSFCGGGYYPCFTVNGGNFLAIGNGNYAQGPQLRNDGGIGWSTTSDPLAGIDTAIFRPLAAFIRPTDGTATGAGGIEMKEMSDPAAAGTNIGRLYVRDNGSGKSQLVIRFPTGAIQVIATEP